MRSPGRATRWAADAGRVLVPRAIAPPAPRPDRMPARGAWAFAPPARCPVRHAARLHGKRRSDRKEMRWRSGAERSWTCLVVGGGPAGLSAAL
jgi:NADPH-dependent 2,4-dienoyl-CoA reductase/sulfur reductase-like enzyme